MKNKLQLTSLCIAALAFCEPATVHAAGKTSPSPAPSKAAAPAAKNKTERAVPFHGMISEVDQTARTFTLAGKEKTRVFKVTGQTVLTKAGVPATMKDVVASEEVRGSYVKAADGSLEAKTVKLGAMTDAEKAASSKSSKKKAKPDTAAEVAPSVSPSP